MIRKMLPFLLIMVSLTFAQYPVNWVNWDYINVSSDVTRSVAYNPHTDHVLVLTRLGQSRIVVLDAATGDSVNSMSMAGLVSAASTYPVNMIAVAGDGTIYISNLAEQVYAPGSKFKIHRYADESSDPVLVYEEQLDKRFGDAMAAVGSANGKYIYASGQGNDQVMVLRDEGGATLVFDSYIDLPQAGNARHGISPVSPAGNIWVNGADSGYPPPSLIAPNGTLISIAPDSILSAGGTSTILYNKFGQHRVISTLNAYHATVSSARIFEDELGTVTYGYFGDNYFDTPEDTVSLFHKNGWAGNINATGTLSYDSRRHSLIVLLGTNSIGSISMDRLLKASTPRDSIWAISIDGVNDFYPTDHVGRSNDHEMYLTWSAGKVFAGITGHTLVDATETNMMYLAFDLDPDGTNGSDTPPEDAGGVTALPFKADVVIKVEPWSEADYMIGSIFKWSGSAWVSTNFDGNIAAQGALAFAAEGNDKLAEVAAIRNAAGIGNDFTNISIMAYVAEKTASGNVLCAFPQGNPTGNGVALTNYYYADALGAGMFPTDPDHVQIRGTSTAIEKEQPIQANKFELYRNYPNPFNPETKISYFLGQNGNVKLEVYDITGRLLETLVSGNQRAGKHTAVFNAAGFSTGVYFYKLMVDGQTVNTRKMVLMK